MKKNKMSGIEMFTKTCSNLQGWTQVYRFFDRLAACSTGTEINKPNMMAFLERYPQYWQKINPEGTNAKTIKF